MSGATAPKHIAPNNGKDHRENDMAILIIALVMTTAMMAATLHVQNIERKADLFRQMRAADRGKFADEG